MTRVRSIFASSVLASILALGGSLGCSPGWTMIDVSAVQQARMGFAEYGGDYPLRTPEVVDEVPAERPSVIIAELLAIFPGLLVHGLGHYYAGDYWTARRLRHIGELGYVLTVVGGGMFIGGYYLDQEDIMGPAYGLYASGGVLGVAGIAYFFTAWIYDMIDTPRAVESGGRRPPRSKFLEDMDIFE